ncbi:autotransporter outer membrane beta-barrel domain-containing protein [Erwinia sp. S63]|uniref:autotransporter outer membrane beta-barrel domain-containing protein n=1 Tax=Erwinia sp. S63 TaxID=2769341 RepID=UPI00190C5FBB|nr:autotransporter outer membrane beta-barrel domain-containing protein [Erwinia sp. S63]
MFKLNPVLLSLVAAQGLMFPISLSWAAELKPYTPEINDNKVGAYCLCNGSTQTLSGLPQFAPGESGATTVTFGELQRIGRIINDNLIGEQRLQIGPQNLTIQIPNFEDWTYTTYDVYNTADLVDLPSVGLDTVVPDYYDVNDKQYINARLGSVSNGKLNIDIGEHGAAANSSTNSWSMAAKQSQLFTATKKGHLNWNSDNRIAFTAATPPYGGDRLAYDAGSVVNYAGAISVSTLDGGTTRFNIQNINDLRNYNNWLIEQVSVSNLSTDRYNAEFHKAFIQHDGRVVYRMSTNNYDDEVAQSLGDQVVLSADGKDASVKINRGKTLEVLNSHSAVMRASNGAKAIINGKLASNGSGLELLNHARGRNNGVINAGFLNNADGKGVDSNTIGAGIGVLATNGSRFSNDGVINFQPGNSESAAISLYDARAINRGNINLGVTETIGSGSMTGVIASGAGGFTNAKGGTLYIGRTPQNHNDDPTSDVAVNLSGGASAIRSFLDSRIVNNGRIVIGSLAQNTSGMLVEYGPNTIARNNGVIDVNGMAERQPRENIGMLVVDAGSGGKVGNGKAGTINLNGYNSTGLKVIAHAGESAKAYSHGAINILSDAGQYGTTDHNTAVWVIGEEGGNAVANVSGPIQLGGNDAIGIRAEGNATVNVSANAIPVAGPRVIFGLERQISFYTKGENAKINLPKNGSFSTSVVDGTIFRVEDGADFDGRGLSLSMNELNTTGVYGSGVGTQVNTNGATLNIGNGDYGGIGGTGIKIAHGAQGTIDAATRFNLDGSSVLAAEVDGLAYTLQGEAIDYETGFNTDTHLTNHAEINGSGRFQIGLIARNQAQLTNIGDITFTGEDSTGIYAERGGKVTNSGTINMTLRGQALYAYGLQYDSDTTALSEISNSGTINIFNRDSFELNTTIGLVASNSLARIYQNGTINLYGEEAMGASAFLGGRITFGADSRITFNDPNQTGYRAADEGTQFISNGNNVDVSSANSTLYDISNGAWLYTQNPGNVTLSGENSRGIVLSGEGTQVSSTDNYVASGKGASVMNASNRAEGVISSGITLSGENTTAAIASGDETEIYAASTISGNGANATAFDVSGGARLFNQYQGVVDLSGSNSTGARVHDGGNFINRGSMHIASGIGIDVSSGYGQYVPVDSALRVDDGIAAMRVGSGAWMKIYGDGQGYSVMQANGSADGLLLDVGAEGFEADNITIGAYGSGSAINNRAETPNINLDNVRLEVANGNGIRSATSFNSAGSVQINVSGSGTGYRFENANGSTTSNDLVIGPDYSIVVTGTGNGVIANTRGNVISQGLIDIQAANGGSAIVTQTASQVVNQGTISSQSRVAPLIDLRGGQTVFINEGTINAPFPDQVVVAGGATDDVIALLDGVVVGDVNTGNGRDELIVTGGTIKGSLTMGSGAANQATVQKVSLADTRHITTENGAGSTLNLSQLKARGGSFASDDSVKGTNLGSGWSTLNFHNTQWTLTDNIKLAHSTINVDSGSTLFAGDNVNPLLQGSTRDSLVVNNAGTLDLTNGGNTAANTLKIDGELASAGGSVRLNATAASSDVVLVNGAASGVTQVDVKLVGAPLFDSNGDGVIAANEGVSLAQVSGSANANSFVLKSGYVASGPWQYGLYSFAPGSNDAARSAVGGSAWDYRLANTFVCEDGSLCQPSAGSAHSGARLAVTPQVPSYLSAPVGLAYYSLAITDDLHKRLGELRQQQANPDAVGGEMFIRYIGSNLKYQTSQSVSHYGYDFDLDYSAVQLGGNVIRVDGADCSLRGGVAYTRGNTRIRPHAADGYSSTSFDSDTLSLYGTWLRDSGFYVDGSLSWGWHRGATDIARQKDVAKPKGNGWTASIETGYPLELGGGVRIEPQAQVTWLQMKMDSFTDRDNTHVSYDDYSQTIGRVGARLDKTWQDGSANQYTPYLRVNYTQGWGGTAKAKIGAADVGGDETFDSGKFGKMWDVGVGGTATVNKDVALYAEADYRKEIDGNGAKGWRYNAGVRWSF